MKTILIAGIVVLAAAGTLRGDEKGGGPPGAAAEQERVREEMLEALGQGWRPFRTDWREPPAAPEDAGSSLRRKIETIVIPVVSFSNVELGRALAALGALAEEYDATGLAPKGANIVLLDPANANPALSITLRNLTLKRILDFVTDAAGYQYSLDPDAIVVRPGGERTALVTEVFPVTRSTLIRMVGRRNAEGGGRESRGAGAADAVAERGLRAEEAQLLRQFWQRAGVNFDGVAGSALAFDGSAVIVTQTPRNLERIRTVLRRYREVRQVEIEARFIDVQEGALNEIGVQWDVGRRSGTVLDAATGLPLLDSDGTPVIKYRERYRTADASAGTVVTRTLADAFRSAQQSSDIIIDGEAVGSLAPPTMPGTNNLGQGAGNLAAISGSIGEFDVNAVVRALEQKNGADLLSAPRVTVLSGSEAVIMVAQEMRYPQSFGEIQSQVGAGHTSSDSSSGSAGVTITAGTPKDFTTRNVGVELRVTPTVEDDGRSISLELNPKVTEFEGFVEFGGPSIAISSGHTVTVPAGFYQPVFAVREVSTRVTLWDGATIVMGGLTREEVKKVRDKVPILGDIPLIGRAFRSEGRSTQKRSLLIFLTARLVNPAGAASALTEAGKAAGAPAPSATPERSAEAEGATGS